MKLQCVQPVWLMIIHNSLYCGQNIRRTIYANTGLPAFDEFRIAGQISDDYRNTYLEMMKYFPYRQITVIKIFIKIVACGPMDHYSNVTGGIDHIQLIEGHWIITKEDLLVQVFLRY